MRHEPFNLTEDPCPLHDDYDIWLVDDNHAVIDLPSNPTSLVGKLLGAMLKTITFPAGTCLKRIDIMYGDYQ
jgi:hypothetical protein